MSAIDDLIIPGKLHIPAAEFDFRASRSSGPGGQNVNKVNTRIQMWWDVTNSPSIPDDVRQRFRQQNRHRLTSDGVLLLESRQHRTQLANRRECVEELTRLLTAALVRPKRRRKTKPTKGSRERRLQAKRELSQKKQSRRFRPDH